MGFQYMRKLECPASWQYRVEREVPAALLEERGLSAAYIDKLLPVAVVKSAVHAVTAAGETCGSGNSESPTLASGRSDVTFTDKECPDPPSHKVGFDIGGSETVYEAELPYREDYRVSERRMKFLSPLTSGDLKIMAEVTKTVSGGSPFTATGFITLPDLRIDRPMEVGCFALPASFDSSHSAVADLDHEGRKHYYC